MIKENWTLNNYQMQAREFAIYPEDMKITYPTLGLAGEAGEVADKVKKVYRDGRDDSQCDLFYRQIFCTWNSISQWRRLQST